MENISLDLYRLFYVVANYENISKAANVLYITQPAVTQGIKKLEDQIGGKLFFRSKKGVALTEEGKRLYKYIESSILILDNAEKNFNKYVNLEEGKIRIRSGNMLEKIDIYNNITRFAKDYPNIEIEIKDDISSKSVSDLAKGEADLVILNLPFENNYSEKILIQELESRKLQLYCSKEYFEQFIKKDDISIKELENLNFIVPLEQSNTGKVIKEFFEKNDLKIKPKLGSPDAETRLYFAENSFGILIALEGTIKSKNMVKINVKEKLPNINLGIATLNKDIIGFATKELVDYIKGEK